MNFTTKTASTLEYDKIIEKLAALCATDGARARARSLLPTDDEVIVRRRLAGTSDARRLIDRKGYPGFSADEQVIPSAERAEKGATLTTTELLHIASMLRSVKSCKDYAQTDKAFDTVLDEIFDRLLPNPTLEGRISRAIISADLIADEASPALADIRRKIKAAHNRIKETLQSYVTGSRQRALQENIVTVRDGRYVIPVKQEYRAEVKGIIHDTSSSGATVFIEPMAVVEANNELRSLEIKEQHEIERILTELSALCGDFAGSLRLNYLNLTDLAFAFACGTLSIQMAAVEPVIRSARMIKLVRARHPLIDKQKVVPISVSLGEEYDTLIITGPNTGGKTVTMKTMGLFCAMAQAGLHLPADPGTEIGMFSEILVDIGDEQSIEQSLSTFSSHMKNIVDMLSSYSPRSLVLLDELGAGTDPAEGAALAIAIIEEVRKSGALTASTTHYTELKLYALDTEGVMNASCEFDVDTLRPTYRLIVGTPGKSNAFAISEKLGLPATVVDRARTYVSGETSRFESVIEGLEQSRIRLEQELAEAERLRKEYEKEKTDLEKQLHDRLAETEASVRRDRERARQLLDSARINSEFVFSQLEGIRKKQDSAHLAEELERTRRAVRERMREAQAGYDAITFEDRGTEEKYVLPRPLKIGDKVYVVPYKMEAEVTALPDGKRVKVKSDIFRGAVSIDDVRLVTEKAKSKQDKKKSPGGTRVTKTSISQFKSEIDVRGMYGDDAWYAIDKYLDEAVLSGLDSVRIIHGKGTGALRAAIQKELRGDPRVKSFRMGSLGEGDTGVTVVTLK